MEARKVIIREENPHPDVVRCKNCKQTFTRGANPRCCEHPQWKPAYEVPPPKEGEWVDTLITQMGIKLAVCIVDKIPGAYLLSELEVKK